MPGPPDAGGFPFEPGDLRVTDYGAVGDGVHDDRPAIQAAMDAARALNGTVYFDPGTYLLLTSTAAGSQLLESNFGAPFTLNLVGNHAALVTSQVGGTMLRAQGAWQSSTVEGLTFLNTHGLTTSASTAIALEGTNGNLLQHWTLTQCTFENFSAHITTTGVNDVTIQDNDFIMQLGRDSGAGTNEPQPTVGIWLFDNAGNDGISVDVKILNNRYLGCGTLTDLSSTASRSCGDGFVFGRSIGTIVRGNNVRGFSAEGIFIIYEPTAGAGVTVDQNRHRRGTAGAWRSIWRRRLGDSRRRQQHGRHQQRHSQHEHRHLFVLVERLAGGAGVVSTGIPDLGQHPSRPPTPAPRCSLQASR